MQPAKPSTLPSPPATSSSSPEKKIKYPASLVLELGLFLLFSFFTVCLSAFSSVKAVKAFSGHKGLTQ